MRIAGATMIAMDELSVASVLNQTAGGRNLDYSICDKVFHYFVCFKIILLKPDTK